MPMFGPGIIMRLRDLIRNGLWPVSALFTDATRWQVAAPIDPSGPANAVKWAWTGAISNSGVTITHKLNADAANVRLAVSISPDLSNPVFSKQPIASASLLAKQTLTGLNPGTTYYYGVMIDGVLDTSKIGRFTTLGVAPKPSFSFAFGACAEPDVSGGNWAQIVSANPLFFIAMGDTPYADYSTPYTQTAAIDAYLTTSSAAPTYRQVPSYNIWSDHEFGWNPGSSNGADNSCGATQTTAQIANTVAFARNVWPNPVGPFSGATEPVGYSFAVGRVLFIVPDLRSQMSLQTDGDSAAHTKLGAAQKDWLKAQILAARNAGQAICLVSEVPWKQDIYNDGDGWAGFSFERREIADFCVRAGVANNQVHAICGDMHTYAIDGGTNGDYASGGGLPVPYAGVAPMGHKAVTPTFGPYSVGSGFTTNVYGIQTVTENGDGSMTIGWAVNDSTGASLLSYSFSVPASQLAPAVAIPVAYVRPDAPAFSWVGQTLSVINPTWGNSPTSYAYQFLRDGTPISGASGSLAAGATASYTAVSADAGHVVTCQISATNAAGTGTVTTRPIYFTTNAPGVYDNFSGTVSSTLVSHAADSGHSWTATNGAWLLGTLGEAVPGTVAGTPTSAVATSSYAPASADYYVAAEFVWRTYDSTQSAYLIARSTGTNVQYAVGYRPSTGRWTILKINGSTVSEIAGVTASAPALHRRYAVRFELSGTMLTLFLDGVQIAAGSDASYTGAGAVGIKDYTTTVTRTTGCHIAAFRAGALG